MSTNLEQIAADYPSSHAGSYLYRMKPVDFGSTVALAVISSADELLLLDSNDITRTPTSFPDIPKGVTCLATGDVRNARQLRSVVACGGQDGVAALYDVRDNLTCRGITIEQGMCYANVDIWLNFDNESC